VAATVLGCSATQRYLAIRAALGDTGRDQLGKGDHPVLPRGKPRNLQSDLSADWA
jgi:hypothetical protein